MAVSWRVVVFLLALITFGFFYGILSEPVSPIEQRVQEDTGTEETNEMANHTSTIWTFAPVFVLIGVCAWLLKEAVVVSG